MIMFQRNHLKGQFHFVPCCALYGDLWVQGFILLNSHCHGECLCHTFWQTVWFCFRLMNLNDCQKYYLYFQTTKIKRLSASQLFLFLSLSVQNYWSPPLSANSGFISLSKISLIEAYLSQTICLQTVVFYKVLEKCFFFPPVEQISFPVLSPRKILLWWLEMRL